MSDDQTKMYCPECQWHGLWHERLTGKHPFYADLDIYGCPKCKAIETLRHGCVVAGCREGAVEHTTWSDPSGAISRYCWIHAPWGPAI